MNVTVRKYEEKDLPDLIRIWNEVVEDGVAFPQEECLNEETGKAFFFRTDLYSCSSRCGKRKSLRTLHSSSE